MIGGAESVSSRSLEPRIHARNVAYGSRNGSVRRVAILRIRIVRNVRSAADLILWMPSIFGFEIMGPPKIWISLWPHIPSTSRVVQSVPVHRFTAGNTVSC